MIQILEEKCAGESQQQSYENAEYDSLAQAGANAERRRSAVENLDVWSDGRFLHASLLILLQQVAVCLIEDVGFESQLADLRFHPGEFQQRVTLGRYFVVQRLQPGLDAADRRFHRAL